MLITDSSLPKYWYYPRLPLVPMRKVVDRKFLNDKRLTEAWIYVSFLKLMGSFHEINVKCLVQF